jgi:hypothetical protein
LHETKTYAPYCGGVSRIYVMNRDGAKEIPGQEVLAEEMFTVLLVLTTRQLFYVSTSGDDQSAEATLDNVKKTIMQMRTLYQRGLPFLKQFAAKFETAFPSGALPDDGHSS